MTTRFQEFLRQRSEGSDLKERTRRRREWLGALKGLLDTVRDWLREAEQEDLLEIVPYEVERVEERLGIYDAPALRIRSGTDSIDVLPVGRSAIGPVPVKHWQSTPGHDQKWGDLSGGRVDITNGERKYLLLRSTEAGQDAWYAVGDPGMAPIPFDRDRLEAILEDLLS
jgi:hypothetical protein